MDGNYHRPVNQTFRLAQVDDFGFGTGTTPGMCPGGYVELYSAGAILNVGDVVYFSGAGAVNKSVTAGTTLGKLAGVVVGGKTTDFRGCTRKLDVGLQAAASGEGVLVLHYGKAYVTAAAALSAGDLVAADTVTAGRVKAGTHTTDTVAGNSGNLVGNLLEAAAGAASVALARIHLN